jgi:hypothetical protein
MNSARIVPPLQTLSPLNDELNPICYLLALLGAHHFLYVSRIRVKKVRRWCTVGVVDVAVDERTVALVEERGIKASSLPVPLLDSLTGQVSVKEK